ncbi:hypothetical protein CO172_03250 [Candidatus Uhrbacteria bacterium CG_4_9_14_3_um_filter_36_7]|uniref:O-antigen ligase-related domain-containing protein n=1 Tax=Candidatus Uhrbacteria bacterium CG_4_9_14_3_um_filter_36_7 TaxID=1975033 RepID=A0A2M7XGN0_9BACT|nr:MAG: hypothetical protein CO172_03250 [Candidatus Uhrbacteria bacterium CG_4_9_14_3_um_filter_36_7]
MLYLFLLFICVLLFGIIAWKDIQQATILFFGLLPTYLLRITIFGLPTTLLEMLFWVLFLIWFIQRFEWKKQKLLLPVPLIILFLAASISLFVAPNIFTALGIWKSYFLEPIIFFLIIRSVIQKSENISYLFISFGVSALFISLFGIVQFLTGLSIPIPWDVERRITSIFPYPNALGLFIGPALMISFFESTRLIKQFLQNGQKSIWLFCFWISVFIFGSMAIFFSKTEAAWGAVVGTILFSSWFIRDLRKITIPFAIICAIVLLSLPALHVPFFQKITFQDYSGTVRLKQWEETVELLKNHWLFGAGLSGYPTKVIPYHTHPEIEIFQYPHNIILNIWTELGLVGLAAFILLMAQVLALFIESTKYPLQERWISIICFSVLLEIMIHGLVDVPYFKNDLAMLTMGILAIFYLNTKQKHSFIDGSTETS